MLRTMNRVHVQGRDFLEPTIGVIERLTVAKVIGGHPAISSVQNYWLRGSTWEILLGSGDEFEQIPVISVFVRFSGN